MLWKENDEFMSLAWPLQLNEKRVRYNSIQPITRLLWLHAITSYRHTSHAFSTLDITALVKLQTPLNFGQRSYFLNLTDLNTEQTLRNVQMIIQSTGSTHWTLNCRFYFQRIKLSCHLGVIGTRREEWPDFFSRGAFYFPWKQSWDVSQEVVEYLSLTIY